MRILILEDDPIIALDLQLVVEGCGHEVVSVCETLAEARECLADDLDFAFLDIDLPDGKSFGVAAELKERRVPFAFVSASMLCDLPLPLRQARFIPKPYHHASIRKSLMAGNPAAA